MTARCTVRAAPFSEDLLATWSWSVTRVTVQRSADCPFRWRFLGLQAIVVMRKSAKKSIFRLFCCAVASQLRAPESPELRSALKARGERAAGGASAGVRIGHLHREERLVGKATKIAAIIGVATMAVATIVVEAAEQAAASTFVTLKLEGACDAQNTRLWLINSHTFKTIATTVRWRAAGGKDLQEQFYPGPNSIREIGCASEAEILDAKFADF